MSAKDSGLDPSQYKYAGSFTGVAGLTDHASANDLESYGDKFSQLFQNYVGRKPTDDEVTQFYQQVVKPVGAFPGGQSQALRDNTASYVNDTYQQAAQDQVNQKLQSQVGQAQSLADMFRQQGNSTIDSTQQSLLDYQNNLFERLRPNLITSLQAQGLLNTGGLNQAVAGAQKDLADSGSNYVAGLRLQNNQNADQIAFAGASAPYQFQQAQALNQVPFLQSQGQNALGNTFTNYNQAMNFQDQIALQNNQARLQQQAQPSFLRTLGQGTATSMGNSFGQWFSPGAGGQSGSSGAAAMKLFA